MRYKKLKLIVASIIIGVVPIIFLYFEPYSEYQYNGSAICLGNEPRNYTSYLFTKDDELIHDTSQYCGELAYYYGLPFRFHGELRDPGNGIVYKNQVYILPLLIDSLIFSGLSFTLIILTRLLLHKLKKS